MNERGFGEHDGMGYLLPEDSQLRLRQLRDHLGFLARLAQSQSADGSPTRPPVVPIDEWGYCLGQVSEQITLVLAALKGPARYAPMHAEATAARQARGHAGDGDGDGDGDLVAYRLEEEGDRAQASQSARASTRHAAPDDLADSPRMLFGVTLDQIDALNTLVETIRAYADAVSAEGMADFAEGTLSRLGHSIFDRASEALAFLGEIQDQPLPDEPRVSPFSVREAPASYHVPRVAMDRDALRTLPAQPGLAPDARSSPASTSLH